MDEINGATGTQADPETQPPAGNAEALVAEAVGEAEPPAPVPETISLDEAKKLRSEHKTLRARIKELEAERDAAAAGQQTETDKAIAEARAAAVAELEADVRAIQVESALRAAGVGNENLLRVISQALDDVELGEDRRIANLEQVVERARKDFPEAFGQAVPAATRGYQEHPAERPKTLEGAIAARLSS
jgi:alcohol dehydrogenase class IV